MKTDDFTSSYPLEAIKQDDKCASRQLRWLRVSPYLLLSWLAAGISLPLAMTILATTQYHSTVIYFPAKSSSVFTINDILHSQHLRHAGLSFTSIPLRLYHSIYSSKYAKEGTKRLQTLGKINLSKLSTMTLNTQQATQSDAAVFSRSTFTFRPHVNEFSLLSWITRILGIRAGP